MKKRMLTNGAVIIFATVIMLAAVLGVYEKATAQATKPIVIKYVEGSPLGGVRTEGVKWFGDEVERRTGGKIKFQYFWAGSLVGFNETPEALKTGVADMGPIVPPYYPEKFPLNTVSSVIIGASDLRAVVNACWNVAQEIPAAAEEFKKWNLKLISGAVTQNYDIIAKKTFRTIGDFAGGKIRVTALFGPVIAAAGGVPVSLTAAEVYESIERGVVQGATSYSELSVRYKWYEIAKYVTVCNLGASSNTYPAMNLDTWNKIPPDLQKIILEVGQEAMRKNAEGQTNSAADQRKMMEGHGVQFIEMPANEQAKWFALPQVKAIAGDWIAKRNAQGLPGQLTYDTYIKHLGQKK